MQHGHLSRGYFCESSAQVLSECIKELGLCTNGWCQRQKFPLSFKLFVLMLPPSPSANQLPNKWKIVQLKGSSCVWIDVRDVSIALKDFHISRRLFLTTYLVKRKRKRSERAIRHRRQRRARTGDWPLLPPPARQEGLTPRSPSLMMMHAKAALRGDLKPHHKEQKRCALTEKQCPT